MKRIAKTLLGLNAVALVHLFRLRLADFLIACSRAFSAARNVSQIPEISLDEILGDRKPVIRLTVARYDEGMLPSEQVMVLLAILVAEAPKEVLEIGTFMGHTARQMAENLEDATIHTVDLPIEFSPVRDRARTLPKDDFHLIARRVVGREFRDRPCATRITQHFADTATWDFSSAGSPSFFFIDGSHTYDYCKNDSEKCLRLAAKGSTFLWHDCDRRHPGVLRYLMECRQQGMDIRQVAGTPIAYWKHP